MIKWLICLVWGHDLNEDKKANITYHKDDTEIIVGRYLQCNRCHKYKEVFHV